MHGETRWNVVPKSVSSCLLSLVAGVLLLGGVLWQMTDAGDVAIIPMVSAVLSVALIVLAVVGLVRLKVRDR